jgi:hypothetical protein
MQVHVRFRITVLMRLLAHVVRTLAQETGDVWAAGRRNRDVPRWC